MNITDIITLLIEEVLISKVQQTFCGLSSVCLAYNVTVVDVPKAVHNTIQYNTIYSPNHL